jgi:hypothetical protein
MVATIIETLQKLIAHESSARTLGSIAEAEAFASKIQELLFRHNLTMAELSPGDDRTDNNTIGQDNLRAEDWGFERSRQSVMWRAQLANAVASSMMCKLLRVPSSDRLILIGTATNRAAASALIAHLMRLAADSADYAFRAYDGPIHGKTWKTSYLLGFASAINSRLSENTLTLTSSTPSAGAMVLASQTALSNYVSQAIGRVRSGPRAKVNSGSAYSAGFERGSNVSLKARASLN